MNIVNIFIVSIVLIVSFILVEIITMTIRTKSMKPIETKKIINDIYAIKTKYVNFFVVKCNDKYIAIDAGINIELAKEELNKVGIPSYDIIAVFLTHSHYDHIASLDLFKNATIFISNKEKIKNKIIRNRFDDKKMNNKYKLVDDEQIINIGGTTVKCLLTSGHTGGSMSFLLNNSYLFTGDAAKCENGQLNMFVNKFESDNKKSYESINKIKNINEVEYIFTAHYGYLNN